MVSSTKQQKPAPLLTKNDIAERLQVSPSTVYRMVRLKKMPQPLMVGESMRWQADVIDDWIYRGCPKVKG